MRSQLTPRRGGFTMIELAIVMVIVGVTAAVSVPRIGPMVANERARRGATEIATFLEYALIVAARTDKPVTIQFDSTTGLLKLANRATSTVIRQVALQANSEYQFQRVTFTPTGTIVVFPSGVSSSPLTVSVGMSSGFSKTITASRAGQVRVQ